jgi:hypothetical protein
MAQIQARPRGLFSWDFDLSVDGEFLADFDMPNHLFTRACTLEFPDDLPVPVQVFLFWLVALMWRRAASDAAAGGSS